jgi:hypothetical protein
MKVLELFSGTRSVGKICDELGWDSFSVDLNLTADLKIDIMEWDYKKDFQEGHFDIIHASPPCHTFSKIQNSWIGRKNKDGVLIDKEYILRRIEREGLPLLRKAQEIIDYFKPRWYFIENPATGKMKDYLDLPHFEVDYCMYSDWGYKKATMIWTNLEAFHPLKCNKRCGNMVGNIHKVNLANGPSQPTLYEKYRLPPNLVRDLFKGVSEEATM